MLQTTSIDTAVWLLVGGSIVVELLKMLIPPLRFSDTRHDLIISSLVTDCRDDSSHIHHIYPLAHISLLVDLMPDFWASYLLFITLPSRKTLDHLYTDVSLLNYMLWHDLDHSKMSARISNRQRPEEHHWLAKQRHYANASGENSSSV